LFILIKSINFDFVDIMLLEKDVEGPVTLAHYNSSNILQTIYHAGRKTLIVIFARGNVYQYYPVTMEAYAAFESAESQMKHLNQYFTKSSEMDYEKKHKLSEAEVKVIRDRIDKMLNEEKK
jgi:hypothetical protein